MSDGYTDEDAARGALLARAMEASDALHAAKGLLATFDQLRSELDAALARVAELEARVNDLTGEIENMDQENVYLMTQRDAALARVKELEESSADVVRAVRELLAAVDLVPGPGQVIGELDYQTFLSAADHAQSSIRDLEPI